MYNNFKGRPADNNNNTNPWNQGGHGSFLDNFGKKERTGMGAHLHIHEDAFLQKGNQHVPTSVSAIEEQLLLGMRPSEVYSPTSQARSPSHHHQRSPTSQFNSPPQQQQQQSSMYSPSANQQTPQHFRGAGGGRSGGPSFGAPPPQEHQQQPFQHQQQPRYHHHNHSINVIGGDDAVGATPPPPQQQRSGRGGVFKQQSSSPPPSSNNPLSPSRVTRNPPMSKNGGVGRGGAGGGGGGPRYQDDDEPGEDFFDEVHRLRSTQDEHFKNYNVYGTPKYTAPPSQILAGKSSGGVGGSRSSSGLDKVSNEGGNNYGKRARGGALPGGGVGVRPGRLEALQQCGGGGSGSAGMYSSGGGGGGNSTGSEGKLSGGPAKAARGSRKPPPSPMATMEANELREELKRLRAETSQLREAMGQTMDGDDYALGGPRGSSVGLTSPTLRSPQLLDQPLSFPQQQQQQRPSYQLQGSFPLMNAPTRQVTFMKEESPPKRAAGIDSPPKHGPVLPSGAQAPTNMHPVAVMVNQNYNSQLTAEAMDMLLNAGAMAGGFSSPPTTGEGRKSGSSSRSPQGRKKNVMKKNRGEESPGLNNGRWKL